MKRTLCFSAASALLAVGIVGPGLGSTQAAFMPIPLGNTNYMQNFNTLISSGKSKNLPQGWAMTYNGDSDVSIFADDGSATMGRIYSYGANGSGDRALGSLRDNGLPSSAVVAFGADFQNTGGAAITRLNISYTGEEWRLGAMGRGADRLQFQYSLNASSVSSGTWVNAPSLDFITPNLTGVGAHDGNLAANQTQIASSIGFLNIPVGATFWVRWVDAALPGGGREDGLAVDNFSISAVPEASTLLGGMAAVGLIGFAFRRDRFGIVKAA